MAVYIFIPIMLLVFGGVFYMPFSRETAKKLYLFFAFGMLFFFMAFRSVHVGSDNAMYTYSFMSLRRMPWKDVLVTHGKAPVYWLVCKALYTLFPFQQTQSVASALVICICMAAFFRRYSDNLVITLSCYVLLYFYMRCYNITRQSIAVSLMLYAFLLMDDGKWVKATILGLLTVGVHSTAAVFFVFLYLSRIKLTRRTLFVFLAAAVGVLAFFSFLFPLMAQLFARIFPQYGGYLLATAVHPVWETSRGDTIFLFVYYVVFFAGATYVVFRPLNRDDEPPQSIGGLYMLVLFGLVCALGASSNMALDRVRDYFLICMCCMIPNVIERFRHNRTLIHIANYMLLLLPYGIVLSRNLGDVVPYSFFWSI